METKKLCELLEGIQSHAHEMIQQIEQALQQQKLINQEISLNNPNSRIKTRSKEPRQ